jgi:hypothetical protein
MAFIPPFTKKNHTKTSLQKNLTIAANSIVIYEFLNYDALPQDAL